MIEKMGGRKRRNNNCLVCWWWSIVIVELMKDRWWISSGEFGKVLSIFICLLHFEIDGLEIVESFRIIRWWIFFFRRVGWEEDSMREVFSLFFNSKRELILLGWIDRYKEILLELKLESRIEINTNLFWLIIRSQVGVKGRENKERNNRKKGVIRGDEIDKRHCLWNGSCAIENVSNRIYPREATI